MIGQPGALWIPSPFHNNHTWNTHDGKPHFIIIHGTASGINYSAQSTARDFQSSGVATHYVVGYDGTIVQCVDESNGAWGNGGVTGPSGVAPKGGGNPKAPHDSWWTYNPNEDTISIEHSKSADNQSQLSSVQLKASMNLIAGICQRWGIPRRYAIDGTGGITGHYSMDPVNKAFCPGPYPFDQVVNFIGGLSSSSYTVQQTSNIQQTGTFSTPPSVISQVHQTLVATPGFYGLSLSLDEAEQFPGYIDVSQPTTYDIPAIGTVTVPDASGIARSIAISVSDNFLPFAIRSGLVVLGSALLLSLVAKAAKPIIVGSINNAETS